MTSRSMYNILLKLSKNDLSRLGRFCGLSKKYYQTKSNLAIGVTIALQGQMGMGSSVKDSAFFEKIFKK